MRLALSTGWFPARVTLEGAARGARDLGLDRLALVVPGLDAPDGRAVLRAVGVVASHVLLGDGGGASNEDLSRFSAALARATAVASRLRAGVLVVEGGGLGSRADADPDRVAGDLGRQDEGEAAPTAAARRRAHREAAAERAVRALHAGLATGAPLAVRPGSTASDLLHVEETEWLLDALPRLGLAFDPTRALGLERLGLGPPPEAWADRFASRAGTCFAHGLGAGLAGRGHPDDDGPDWSSLGEMVPRAATWVLDLAPTLSTADVTDAIRAVRAHVG